MQISLNVFFILVLLICGSFNIISSLFQISYSTGQITQPPLQNGFNSTKLIILAFDDSSKTQFNLAKPVLDKYGFKGSFFTVCTFVDNASNGVDLSRMTWNDIKTLQMQGHDIESHTMTHTDLNHKSPQALQYEIGGSKQCLLNHGINATGFAYPESSGGKNTTVIDVVSKYYNLARVGDAPLAFLDCNGYKKESSCNPFQNGKLTYENRYDIRNWSDRPKLDQQQQQQSPQQSNQAGIIVYDNVQMLNQFIHEVNLQTLYNKNGCIETIPIVVHHKFLIGNNLQYLSDDSLTDVNLFDHEMKYLHDNGFTVLKMSDLTFDPIDKDLEIKGYGTNLKNC